MTEPQPSLSPESTSPESDTPDRGPRTLDPRPLPETLEKVLLLGDLSKLTPQERIAYYRHVCDSVGLNPATRPFDYITLNGKLTLYARRDATDQLRKLHKVSITKLIRERVEELYIVTAQAQDAEGRTDEASGVVSLTGLKGQDLANKLMACESKAKRRVTLSICGLGFLDETEVPEIPSAKSA